MMFQSRVFEWLKAPATYVTFVSLMPFPVTVTVMVSFYSELKITENHARVAPTMPLETEK